MKTQQILLTILLSITLSACGFALRGTTKNTYQTIHDNVVLSVDGDKKLSDSLKKELALNGINTTINSQNHITVNQINIARYELIGVLTEIRLVMTATAQYQINGQTRTHTLTASRSHQYNEAGVSTQDKEETRTIEWLYNDLARQISEQFYTLNTQHSLRNQSNE